MAQKITLKITQIILYSIELHPCLSDLPFVIVVVGCGRVRGSDLVEVDGVDVPDEGGRRGLLVAQDEMFLAVQPQLPL